MYIYPGMINLGLKKNQSFPSEDHKKVAQNISLENPRVNTRDKLTQIVQEVILVPQNKIRHITMRDLPISLSIAG